MRHNSSALHILKKAAILAAKVMRDCYQILGVAPSASAAEIRRAYRKKAKILHPDITHSESDAFRELLDAYKTLSDEKSRMLFDEMRRSKKRTGDFNFTKKKQTHTFDYREWLLERDDDESRARLILFDLLHNREDSAVAEYKRMNMTRVHFKLSKWFTREDFMDYGFILAEELVLRREYYDAVILLDQIIKMEFSYEYFKFFFPEVKDLARHVLRNNIEGQMNDELAIDAWERALDLRFGKTDDTFFLHKMADAYERIGDRQTAAICRDAAQKLSS